MNKLVTIFLMGFLLVINAPTQSLIPVSPNVQEAKDDLGVVKGIAERVADELDHNVCFGPLIDRYFVDDFLSRFEMEGDGFPLAVLPTGTPSKISLDSRLRYYEMTLTLYYLMMQYQLGRDQTVDDPEGAVPSDVRRVFAKNKMLLDSSDSASENQPKNERELLKIVGSMEKGVVLMRKALKHRNPKEAETYKESLGKLYKAKTFFKPWQSKSDKACYGFPVGTTLYWVDIPFLQLLLVKIDEGVKVLSIAPYVE